MSSLALWRMASVVGIQIGWVACVLGAARGHPWIGPAVVVVVVSDHVRRQPSKLPEIVVLSLSALVGFVVDTAFLRFGVFRIPRTMFAPPWLVALWPSFATTTATSGPLSGLRGRPRLSVLFGAVGGPLAYAAGAHWRAIELSGHRAVALAAIGVVWGVFVPALIALRTWEST